MIIDLSGPNGNVFAIMGVVKKLAKEQDLEFQPILDEMMAGNYGHALDIAQKHFSEIEYIGR